ncbi:MAG: HK97 family phage prohead protease [Pseudomonadota bacterium]
MAEGSPIALSAAAPEGRGLIRGYASRFGEADRKGDIVERGAFAKGLAELKRSGRRVAMLWQHDQKRPIGVWDIVAEDAIGLWVEGRVLTELALGREALALMRAGALDGLSIGYRVRRASPEPRTGGRRLTEIELWEVSLVTFPMLPTARASVATGAKPPKAALAGALASALAR